MFSVVSDGVRKVMDGPPTIQGLTEKTTLIFKT